MFLFPMLFVIQRLVVQATFLTEKEAGGCQVSACKPGGTVDGRNPENTKKQGLPMVAYVVRTDCLHPQYVLSLVNLKGSESEFETKPPAKDGPRKPKAYY